MEIVIWEHINGYVFFNALMMGSLFYFKRSFDDDQYRKDVILVLVFLMVGAFLHEWGALFAMMFGVCFYFKNIDTGRIQDNKKIWLFFLPVGFYVLAYRWVNLHYQIGSPGNIQTEVLSKVLQFSNLLHVIKIVPQYFCQLIFNGFFPSQISGGLDFSDRLIFIHRPMFTGEFPLNLTAVCGVLFLIFQGFSTTVTRRNKLFLLLLSGMIACQLITLPLIRLPTHGEQYVFQGSFYYGYLFWSYFLVIIFMVVDWPEINVRGRERLKFLAAASLIVSYFFKCSSNLETKPSY